LYGKVLTRLNDVLKTDKNPVRTFGVCNSYIRTITKSLQQYRLCVQVVVPSMDDVWLHDKIDKVMKQQGEIRKMMKDSGLLPIKRLNRDRQEHGQKTKRPEFLADLGHSL
jgi:hypothetical protein